MKLVPFLDAGAQANELVLQGHTIFQQFQCANCKTKQTIEVPNAFYKLGKCEECAHVTDIVKDGCNFTVMYTNRPDMLQQLLEKRKRKSKMH
jgi:hypothetical protein